MGPRTHSVTNRPTLTTSQKRRHLLQCRVLIWPVGHYPSRLSIYVLVDIIKTRTYFSRPQLPGLDTIAVISLVGLLLKATLVGLEDFQRDSTWNGIIFKIFLARNQAVDIGTARYFCGSTGPFSLAFATYKSLATSIALALNWMQRSCLPIFAEFDKRYQNPLCSLPIPLALSLFGHLLCRILFPFTDRPSQLADCDAKFCLAFSCLEGVLAVFSYHSCTPCSPSVNTM